MRKLLLFIPALLMSTGCPASNPFGPAKETLKWLKTGLNVGSQGVNTYLNDKEVECTELDASKGADYQVCMKTANKVKKYFPPAKATADEVIKTAEDGIADVEKKLLHEKVCEKANPDKKSKEYTDCVEKFKAAVMQHVKNVGCVVLTALDFLPDGVKAQLKVWINLLKSWACTPTAKKSNPLHDLDRELMRNLLKAPTVVPTSLGG